jgi:hypothetical protein
MKAAKEPIGKPWLSGAAANVSHERLLARPRQILSNFKAE